MLNLPIKIFNKIQPEPMSGCWLWVGATGTHGYGNIRDGYSHKRAHRLVYNLLKEKVPDNLVLDHLCKITYCVNPDHLEIITQKQNVQRGNRWK